MRKLYSSTQTRKFNRQVMEEMGVDFDNPIVPAIGTGIEAFTNLPTGRAIQKINNMREAFNDENEMWQRLALMMGWNTWDLNVENSEVEKTKEFIKRRNKNIRTFKTKQKRKSKGKSIKSKL